MKINVLNIWKNGNPRMTAIMLQVKLNVVQQHKNFIYSGICTLLSQRGDKLFVNKLINIVH